MELFAFKHSVLQHSVPLLRSASGCPLLCGHHGPQNPTSRKFRFPLWAEATFDRDLIGALGPEEPVDGSHHHGPIFLTNISRMTLAEFLNTTYAF